MDTQNFLSSHPFSANTKERYARILRDVEGLPLEDWQARDLLTYITKPNWGNSQQNLTLCTLKKYIRWRYGETHPALAAKLKRIQPPPQRVLTFEKALELLASFNPHTPKGSRDLAICALALDTGLRLSELCRLKLADTHLADRTLQVIVKGGQWKTAVYSEATANCLYKWISFRNSDAPTLFTSFQHQHVGAPITPKGLQKEVNKWGRAIGIQLSPHDLRRSFATLATILGAPTRIVQIAGRWSKIETVEIYTRHIEQKNITPYLPVSHLLAPDK